MMTKRNRECDGGRGGRGGCMVIRGNPPTKWVDGPRNWEPGWKQEEEEEEVMTHE